MKINERVRCQEILHLSEYLRLRTTTLTLLSLAVTLLPNVGLAEQTQNPGESISAKLQSSFYRGELAQLQKWRLELERMSKNQQEASMRPRSHYLLGLAWRHEASLSSSKSDQEKCLNHAIQHLEQSIELNPKDAGAHALKAHVCRSLIGLGHRDQDTIQEAIAHRDKAYDLAPTDPRVLTMEGYALIAMPHGRGGNIAEGLTHSFEAAGRYTLTEPDPADLGAAFNWYVIGIGFQKSGDHANAIAAYEKALELKPDWKTIKARVTRLQKSN